MKKRMLRVAVYLLILMMTMTNLPMAMAESEKTVYLKVEHTNPCFEGLEDSLQITQVAPLYFGGKDKEQEYYTDLIDAAAVIRDAMEARQESFDVGIIVDDFPWNQDQDTQKEWMHAFTMVRLLELVFAETENPTEGDSLRLGYHDIKIETRAESSGGKTKLTIAYNVGYYTNAAQEEELTRAVDALLEEFAFDEQTTEKEKAGAIYQWLCDNVDYDYTSQGYLKHTAYAAMFNKKAVCQGYAVLFYRLAEEAGLDARIITGRAAYSGEKHGWNIVRLGESYYYLDATWDANKQPKNYEYYLRGEEDFYGHINDLDYETEQFRIRYPISAGCSHKSDWKRMTNDEYHWYQCTVCGVVDGKEKHSGGTATCTAPKTCTICGGTSGSALGHSYANATCTAPKTCTICGVTSGSALGHNYANATCTAPKTCTVCGAIDGSALGHSYVNATCTAPKTCTVCGAIDGSALGHSYVNATCTAPKTCTVCGVTDGSAFGHNYADATCTAAQKCTRCGVENGKALGHKYTDSCDAECNICKAIRIVAHSFGEYLYNEDATSKTDGTKTRTCTVCKTTETVTASGTKLQNPFKDVKAKEYYAEPVLWAVGKKITNGMSATSFAPNNNCTRGQIVTFLWRAAGSPEPTSTTNPFVDVKSDQYYYKAVLWAVEKGITTGTSDTTFSPDAACTRGQVVTFMWRAKNKPSANIANSFKDVQSDAYYYDAVLWAVKNGITNGMGDNKFASDNTCTRGQIVTFLYRAYA